MAAAPRRSACSAASRMTNPAPSPSTKPSRRASKGRLAVSGVAFWRDMTPSRQKSCTSIGATMHSAPPARATSTVPRRIARYASPIACADEVQAVWIVAVGPSMPKWPARSAARYCGHVRWAARAAARRANSATKPARVTGPPGSRLAYAIAPRSRKSWRSPLVPTNTPARREASTARAPAAATAPRAARRPTTTPRGSCESSEASARNSSISARSSRAAAICVGSPSGSKWVMRLTPETPASAAFQKAFASAPIGVTRSSPVTTMRRRAPGSREERVATVHRQDLSPDRLRRRAREEVHDTRDLVGRHEGAARSAGTDRRQGGRAFRYRLPHVGLHSAGRDRVDRDALRRELDGEIAREPLERRLRDADRRVALDDASAAEARQGDDPSARRHDPRGFLGEDEQRARVRRHHPVPLLGREVEAVPEHARRGVAHEHVEATGAPLDLGHQALDLRGLLQVRLHQVRDATA